MKNHSITNLLVTISLPYNIANIINVNDPTIGLYNGLIKLAIQVYIGLKVSYEWNVNYVPFLLVLLLS